MEDSAVNKQNSQAFGGSDFHRQQRSAWVDNGVSIIKYKLHLKLGDQEKPLQLYISN